MIFIEKLTTHQKVDFNRFTISSIFMSLLIYILHYYFWCLISLLYIYFKWYIPSINEPKILLYEFINNQKLTNLTDFISLILLSIIISFPVSFAINNKWINRIGRTLGITSKYGDESVWEYFHNNLNPTWITLRDLKNDLMYFGWIKVFSDNASNCDELILQDVTVYQNSTGKELYKVNEVYIAEKRENLRIEIYEYKD